MRRPRRRRCRCWARRPARVAARARSSWPSSVRGVARGGGLCCCVYSLSTFVFFLIIIIILFNFFFYSSNTAGEEEEARRKARLAELAGDAGQGSLASMMASALSGGSPSSGGSRRGVGGIFLVGLFHFFFLHLIFFLHLLLCFHHSPRIPPVTQPGLGSSSTSHPKVKSALTHENKLIMLVRVRYFFFFLVRLLAFAVSLLSSFSFSLSFSLSLSLSPPSPTARKAPRARGAGCAERELAPHRRLVHSRDQGGSVAVERQQGQPSGKDQGGGEDGI